MSENRKPSPVIVKVLDLTILRQNAVAYLVKQGKFNPDINILQSDHKYAIAEKAGRHYMICDEGVGSRTPMEEEHSVVRWFREEIDPNTGKTVSFDIIPVMESRGTYEDFLEETSVKEEVSLDKFVRTFGSRLEQNLGTWERFLKG